jgi:hypothetical protein
MAAGVNHLVGVAVPRRLPLVRSSRTGRHGEPPSVCLSRNTRDTLRVVHATTPARILTGRETATLHRSVEVSLDSDRG